MATIIATLIAMAIFGVVTLFSFKIAPWLDIAALEIALHLGMLGMFAKTFDGWVFKGWYKKGVSVYHVHYNDGCWPLENCHEDRWIVRSGWTAKSFGDEGSLAAYLGGIR